jgi:hypothetical protein
MPALHELDSVQCERLLRRGTFGRVGLSTPRGPLILPVNYAVHEDAIVIGTSADGTLAKYGHERRLVFEVDTVEEDRWRGWSVLAHGRGLLVTDPGPRPPGERARPWAGGDRNAELRLVWTELTGRRIGAGGDPEASMYSRRSVE